MDTENTNDDKAMSPASAGYADARLVERAFRDVIEGANEMSRAHTMNYTGLMYALLLKGIITEQELEAAREQARAAVDKAFGPTPEEKKAAAMQELFDKVKAKA
jgi:TPP-dependent pyruvate/acetoin dehydrogenase alpha subunit